MNLINFFSTVHVLVRAQINSRYRNTFAGLIWVTLNPIVTFAVHFFVFGNILKIKEENYYTFLMSGLLPWLFITTTLELTCNIFVSSASLLRSIKINPLLILSAQILDNSFNFLLVFTILFVLAFFRTNYPLSGVMFLPLPFIILILSLISLGFFLAMLQVFYRDILYINRFITSLMFYATPIVYPINFIPPIFQKWVYFNPFYILIRPFQICLWNFDKVSFLSSILNSLIFLFLISAVAFFYWKQKAKVFHMSL